MKNVSAVALLTSLVIALSPFAVGADKPVRSMTDRPVIPAGLHAPFQAQQDSYVDIGTACKRLRIHDQGRLGNNAANASLDFTDAYDPDNCANVYLYDGSPIVCRPDGDSVRCFSAIYDKYTLLPTSQIAIDSLGNPSYTYAVSQFMTSDATIGFIAEYFAPKHPDSCGFVIQKLRFWNRTVMNLPGVAVGEALDWDVPSWPAAKNESGFDDSRRLIYQYGCDRDECDTLLTNERYAGIAAWGRKPFKNYMTLDNATYVSTAGPFGNDAPLPADTIYQLMKNRDGYYPVEVDSCQDLISLVTFGVYYLRPNDTQCIVKILSTSREDTEGAVLKENIDKGNAFINAHDEIECFICDCRPGDDNDDGAKNVGDAVYLIGHIFKGGPAPRPYPICSCDVNGDCACNVGDAVYMIVYVFKFGPPPITCNEWIIRCGMPLRK